MLLHVITLVVAASPPSPAGAPRTEVPSLPVGKSGVYSLDRDAFVAAAAEDLELLRRFATGMQDVLERLGGAPGLFTGAPKTVYSHEQKRRLLTSWAALYAYFSATEGLRQKYWGFVLLPPADARHGWGFVVTHTALTVLLASGLSFAELAAGKPQLETLLNERNDELGIPARAFAKFKGKALHVSTASQLMSGDAWALTFAAGFRQPVGLPPLDWAWKEMESSSRRAKASLARQGVRLFAINAQDVVRDRSFEAIFPAQKGVAEWLGDTRVARVGQPLITPEQVATLVLPRLRPGDVLTARQNWFLSNLGLPGFWPHALLFLGTAAELAAEFDADPDVRAWASAQPERAEHLTGLLAKRYSEKWRAYADGADLQGHSPIRVIEAISEGVSFTAAEHAFGVDYLAAMRPRASRIDRARAVERAFGYQGRPYDFNFDFYSDTALVCTELVFKSYQPGEGMRGLRLELVDVAGRRTLPANELVKTFDREFGRPAQQLDFVFFIDAKEKERRAEDADVAALRKSWQRFQWDIVQR